MKLSNKLHNILKKYRSIEESEIDYKKAKDILKKNNKAILIDVRSMQEYKERHLQGSINISLYDLEKECKKLEIKKEDTIIVYCQSGNRSRRALEILKENGYKNLYEIKGGLDEIGEQ